MGESCGGSSSSSDEDGDAEWRAAIASVASSDFSLPSSNGTTKHPSHNDTQHDNSHKTGLKLYQIKSHKTEPTGIFNLNKSHKTGLEFYQIKAQKVFDEYLDKNLEIVRMPDPLVSDDTQFDGGIIRLFKRAPPGITLDSQDINFVQNKRPRILPGEETNEKSKKFKRQIRSVSVDGTHIIELARRACEKSLARFKEKEVLNKEKAKREEERILELKKVRGEMWLPSIAREMKEEARRKYAL